jgi:hypothetical protein
MGYLAIDWQDPASGHFTLVFEASNIYSNLSADLTKAKKSSLTLQKLIRY